MILKKLALAAVVLVPAVAFLSWSTKVGSYTCTAWSNIQSAANKHIPVEFEISRIKNDLNRLSPDLKKARSAVADEMVAVENLKAECADMRQKLTAMKADCRELQEKLQTGEAHVYFKGQSYDAQVAKRDLDRRVKACKRTDAEIKAREDMLSARERSLDAAKEQLASMKEQKDQLEIQVAQLEADLKVIRLAQTRSKFEFDDSRLGEVKQSLADLRNRLKAEQITLDMENEDIGSTGKASAKPAERSLTEVVNEAAEYLDGAKVADKK